MRYYLFAGPAYYPEGGGWDYVSSHDTVEQAKQAAEDGGLLGEMKWAHVAEHSQGGIEVLDEWYWDYREGVGRWRQPDHEEADA